MIDALMKRTTQVSSGSAHARGGVKHDSFIRWLRSRPVPRELLIDMLRASSKYDRASPVADAHAAHIRALRRRGRRSAAQNSQSIRPPRRRVPTVVVDAEQFESLLEQVRDLRRLADEVTRVRERLDANDRALVD